VAGGADMRRGHETGGHAQRPQIGAEGQRKDLAALKYTNCTTGGIRACVHDQTKAHGGRRGSRDDAELEALLAKAEEEAAARDGRSAASAAVSALVAARTTCEGSLTPRWL